MKETVKINLGQRLFDFDIDAFEALKKYLESLKRYFQKSPKEAEEILQDIEQRMADVLNERLGDNIQIVKLKDVNEVITMMGTVEDFAFDGETIDESSSSESEEKKAHAGTFHKEYRKLYRDIDNNILGGVCAGLAAYFNTDPVWIRLALILLFFLKGIGLLAYLILWIVVPVAHTTAQKLEMQGRPVNVENIEQVVKDELNKVKENIKRFSKTAAYRRTQNTIAEIFSTLSTILLIFLKIILVFIGVTIAFVGIGLIIGLITASSWGVYHHWYFPSLPFIHEFYPYFQNFTLLTLAMIIVLLIPIIAILVGVIRLIFNVKSHNHVLTAFAWTFWTLALVFVIVNLISGRKILSFRHQVKDKIELNTDNHKILFLSLAKDNQPSGSIQHYTFFGHDILRNRKEEMCYLNPEIFIKPARDSLFSIELERSAAIPSFNDKNELLDLYYKWQFSDTLLLLNEYFTMDEEMIWQLPEMQLTLFVPIGKRIMISKNAGILFNKAGNISEIIPEKYFNKVLIMQNTGLRRASQVGR